MKSIKLLIFTLLFISCHLKSEEHSAIQKFLNKNHIDAKVVETSFVKDITAKDSVDYYIYEYFRIAGNEYGNRDLEGTIWNINRLKEFNASDYKKDMDLILFEFIKKEKDKYTAMEDVVLGKLYKGIIKVEGNPYPENINFCLSNDLKSVVRIVE